MKSLDKKKTSELFEGIGSSLHQAFVGAVERDKKKTKELDWAEKILGDYGKITGIYHVDGAEYNVDEKQLISFIKSILTQQRTELLEEINKPQLGYMEETGDGYSDGFNDGIDHIRTIITNLLNEKNEQ